MKYYSGKSEGEMKDIFYITNSNIEKDQKLFTIYNPIKIPFAKDEIIKELKKIDDNLNFSVDVEKFVKENNNDKVNKTNGEICNIILPDTYSRKSFEPILKKFFYNLK